MTSAIAATAWGVFDGVWFSSRFHREIEAGKDRAVEALELWTTRANAEHFVATEPPEIMRGLGGHIATKYAQRKDDRPAAPDHDAAFDLEKSA